MCKKNCFITHFSLLYFVITHFSLYHSFLIMTIYSKNTIHIYMMFILLCLQTVSQTVAQQSPNSRKTVSQTLSLCLLNYFYGVFFLSTLRIVPLLRDRQCLDCIITHLRGLYGTTCLITVRFPTFVIHLRQTLPIMRETK